MNNILDIKHNPAKHLFFTNFYKVLAFFLKNPSGQFYAGDVFASTRLSRAGVNLALGDLYNAGFLEKTSKGRMNFYVLNKLNPLVRELKILFNIVEIWPLVEDLKKISIEIVLYGSAAIGENTEESDVDILVISRNKKEVQKKLDKYMLKRKIQPVIHTPQEWAVIGSGNQVFVEQVNRGKILWEQHGS